MNLRLFIAVPVPEATRSWIAAVLERLRASGADCKWVEPAHVHWTLHFFGNVPEEQAARIRGLMDAAAAAAEPFEWRPGGLGAFPGDAAPKVLWAGLRSGEAEMKALAGRVREAVAAAGFPVEEREFKAHLTLGRVRGSKGLARLSELMKEGVDDGPRARAESLVLYRSELRPEGPTYAVLHASRLGGSRVP